MYQSIPHLRGIWGLEDRDYTAEEVAASAHLQAAVHAGALTKGTAAEEPRAVHETTAASRSQRAQTAQKPEG